VLQSDSVHQIVEFLSFTARLVATLLTSLYAGLVDLAGFLPLSVWVTAAALVLVLVLHSRLSSRIDEVETTLLQLDAKLDSLLSRVARSREPDAAHDRAADTAAPPPRLPRAEDVTLPRGQAGPASRTGERTPRPG